MDQETKDYLCEKGIGEQLFPDIEALQLKASSINLLKQVTYEDLVCVMPRAKARHIHDKLYPLEPLSTNIESFLNECGIDRKYHVFFQRLRLTSIEMIHYVDLSHLLESGMEKIHADIIVKMIKARLNNITIISDDEEEQFIASPKKRPQKKRHSSTASKKRNSSTVSKKRNSSTVSKKRHIKKRRKWPTLPSKSYKLPFNEFLSAKGLHIGPFTKQKFKSLYAKFKLRRQRFGNDKWTYSYNYNGSVKQVQAGLKHVLDILWNIEQKKATLESAAPDKPVEMDEADEPVESAAPEKPVEPGEADEPVEPDEPDDKRTSKV